MPKPSRLAIGALAAALCLRRCGGWATEVEELLLAAATVEADDECREGSASCALHELQVRARATVAEETEAAATDSEESVTGFGSRRRIQAQWVEEGAGAVASPDSPAGRGRRRRLQMWRPTPIVDSDVTPSTCGDDTLQMGYEGCCDGQVYSFADTGCCGSLLYRTSELSCCRHGNHTATIYNPYTTNCCDDPRVVNREGGEICVIEGGQSSCCHLSSKARLRRLRRQSLCKAGSKRRQSLQKKGSSGYVQDAENSTEAWEEDSVEEPEASAAGAPAEDGSGADSVRE